MKSVLISLGAAVFLLFSGCHKKPAVIRVAYSSYLTQAPALIGFSRGDFPRLSTANVIVQPKIYPNSPAIIPEILNDVVTVAYMDPVSAVIACARSEGRVKIVAGVSFGGGALVVSSQTKVNGLDDLRDKRISTTEGGDVHDVTARVFFGEHGFLSLQQGGSSDIFAAGNIHQLELLSKQGVQAAWAVEPWVSLLLKETAAKIFLDEQDVWQEWAKSPAPAAVLVMKTSVIKKYPEVISNLVKTHLDLIQWVNQGSVESINTVFDEVQKLSPSSFSCDMIESGLKRIHFSSEINLSALNRVALNAYRIGLLPKPISDTSSFVERRFSEKTDSKDGEASL